MLASARVTSPHPPKKVRVLVATYNDENFVAEAINSVLMQEVNFDYEIVIIEDCSTDRTRDIVVDFQTQHPEKIRLVLEERNRNNNKSWAREILEAKSQYIALLDGDDYWTSPHKLQKQVDFLDNHPECATCFHNARYIYDDGSREPRNSNPADQKEISTIEDLWPFCFIETCSAMFRRGVIDEFPDWFNTIESADWALHILNAQHGKIGYINEVMGVYRQHPRGVWNRLSRMQQILTVLGFYRQMNANLDFAYDQSIRQALEEWSGVLLTEIRVAMQTGDWKEVFQGIIGFLRCYPEHMLTEFWPCYHPVHLRRYPIVYRLLNRCESLLRCRFMTCETRMNCEGFIDITDSQTISGWIWDVNQPNSPLKVEIYDGDNLLARVLADRFRRDLVNAGKGNGYHAFFYLVPTKLRDGNCLSIHVKVRGHNFALHSEWAQVLAQSK